MPSSLSKLKEKINVKETIILVVVAVFIFLLVRMMFGGLFGISLVVIENGPHSSMWPTYDKGDMFLINKCAPEKIQMGDVIVYKSETFYSNGILIIHRVINITIYNKDSNPQYYYRVSGDNPYTNDRVDDFNSTTSLIPYKSVLGKTVLLIPKIGYLRLWLTESPVFRYLLLGLLLLFAAYLIFYPDKDDEKRKTEKNVEDTEEFKEGEKEKFEKSEKINDETKEKQKGLKKEKLKLFIKESWEKTKQYFKELITVKQKRRKLIIYTSAILVLIIAVPAIDALIRYPNLTTRITGVELLVGDDRTSTENIIYFPLIVHFTHDGSWNTIFKEFTIYGIQNGSVLSTMKWYSFYQKEGDLRIGGSLVFNADDFDRDSSLIIQINYTISYHFGHSQSYDFVKTFDPPFTII
ncbi:MAG: signal peptidase I [Candidatus Heimdallarchaeaceae archaeon]